MKTLIIGAGISGQAAKRFLTKKGHSCLLVDQKNGLSDATVFDPFDFDLVVPSPGIPSDHTLLLEAKLHGIPIRGEASIGLSHIQNRVVGITGTNGKTTLVSLIAHVLNQSRQSARALGNIGLPFTQYVDQLERDEIVIAELSSFQLETLEGPLIDVGVILNITPDHLDRHHTMTEYARAKLRMIDCMKPSGSLMIHHSIDTKYGSLLSKSDYETFRCSQVDLAFAICESFGVSKECFEKALATFKRPPHRLEYIGETLGMACYNDSKATNVDAVIYAVSQIDRPIILLAGGVDKGHSYKSWIEDFRGKVKKMYVFGEAAEKMLGELGAELDIEMVNNLQEAVKMGLLEGAEGDVILLSPGCSSFDMFKDYRHRGEEFKRLIAEVRR